MQDENKAADSAHASKSMLGSLIALVSILFVALQIAVFLFFRWERVDSHDYFEVSPIRWTLNPWVVWLAVGVLALEMMWWWTCRKFGRKWQKWCLLICILVAVSVSTVGLCLDVPEPILPPPSQESPNSIYPQLRFPPDGWH